MAPKEKRPNATKLTLYVDEDVIIKAKQEAIARKTSLSELVENLLRRDLGMEQK
jgi:predicted HicB family RNase H-like nuclease